VAAWYLGVLQRIIALYGRFIAQASGDHKFSNALLFNIEISRTSNWRIFETSLSKGWVTRAIWLLYRPFTLLERRTWGCNKLPLETRYEVYLCLYFRACYSCNICRQPLRHRCHWIFRRDTVLIPEIRYTLVGLHPCEGLGAFLVRMLRFHYLHHKKM
jgi:hypothetical protein